MIILMRSFEQRVFYSRTSRQAAGRDAAAAPAARRSGTIADPRSGSEPHGHPQHTFLDVAGQRLMRLADNGPCSPASRTSPILGLTWGRTWTGSCCPPPAGGLLPANAHRRQHAAEAHQLPDEVRHRRRHLCAWPPAARCATSCASPTRAAPSGSPTWGEDVDRQHAAKLTNYRMKCAIVGDISAPLAARRAARLRARGQPGPRRLVRRRHGRAEPATRRPTHPPPPPRATSMISSAATRRC